MARKRESWGIKYSHIETPFDKYNWVYKASIVFTLESDPTRELRLTLDKELVKRMLTSLSSANKLTKWFETKG